MIERISFLQFPLSKKLFIKRSEVVIFCLYCTSNNVELVAEKIAAVTCDVFFFL